MNDKYIVEQKLVCKTLGVEWIEAPIDFKVSISLGVKEGLLPVHGLSQSDE
ncbi:MAG: hypothetical protein ACFFCZ_03075 [Promethearchaeota archaeon]